MFDWFCLKFRPLYFFLGGGRSWTRDFLLLRKCKWTVPKNQWPKKTKDCMCVFANTPWLFFGRILSKQTEIKLHFNYRVYKNILIIKANLMHYLSSVYFVNQPLHGSGIVVAHHQEVYFIYATVSTCCAFQLTVCWPGRPTDSQLKSTILTNCFIYAVYFLMMGYKYARNI